MEGNKDEAQRCLLIARKHKDAGNFPSARKFCQKSMALFETPEALKLLESIEAAAAASSGSQTASTSSGAENHASSSGIHHRQHSTANGTASGMGGEKREYTAENLAVVKRVRTCKVTEYYEILAIKKDCEDADVKKAYRKLALALHPDKNGAPGADEAFKMVSKAFQVLSDPQKRAVYDQSGSDPEDRTSAAGFSSTPFTRGGGFEGELSPEDLFNMFFGGGAGQFGGFGGGPVFTTTFGPGGFRTTRMGGFPRPQRQGDGNAESRSILLQLLPLIILFAFSMLSALPNLFSTPPIPDPAYSFARSSRYNVERHTSAHDVTYHINPRDFMEHPVIGAELMRQGIDLRKSNVATDSNKVGPGFAKFEANVERYYSQDVYQQCQRALDRKERAKEAEIGLFAIGTDWEKVKRIEAEVIPSCEELKRLGIRR